MGRFSAAPPAPPQSAIRHLRRRRVAVSLLIRWSGSDDAGDPFPGVGLSGGRSTRIAGQHLQVALLPPGTQLKPGLYPVGEVGDSLEVGMAVAMAFVDVAA